MAHPVVDEHEGRHCLDDGDGAWEHAGVVAAAAHQLRLGTRQVHGFLRLKDRRGGLKAMRKTSSSPLLIPP